MIKLSLQVLKQRPREYTQMRGEEMPLQNGPGRCRKKRHTSILELNILKILPAVICKPDLKVTIAIPGSPKLVSHWKPRLWINSTLGAAGFFCIGQPLMYTFRHISPHTCVSMRRVDY